MDITTVNWSEQLTLACRHYNKWGVYVAGGQYDFNDKDSEARFEALKSHVFALTGDYMLIGDVLAETLMLFASEEDARKFYEFFLSKENYSHEYAALVAPNDMVDENT